MKEAVIRSFSEAQVKEILRLRDGGMQWVDITYKINRKFKLEKSAEAIRHIYRKIRGSEPKAAKRPHVPHPMDDFTKEALGDILKRNNHKSGIFFITAASPTSYVDYSDEQLELAKNDEDFVAANVHKEGLQSVLNFCKRNQAELIVLPMRAHVKALREQPQHYDPLLRPHLSKFATEYIFNRHLKAIEAQLNPQQVNPLTGLRRLRGKSDYLFKDEDQSGILQKEIRRKTSVIVAHSKQDLDPIATGNSSHPRILHSTGAITQPAYLRNRIGLIAEEDHVLGGLVVEIEGDKFFIRQVQIDRENGSFVDIGTRYFPNGTVAQERAEAMKLGDIHPGHEDAAALGATYEMMALIKPKRIFFEDFVDCSSISHHLEKKNLTRSKLPNCFKSLEAELAYAKQVFDEIFKNVPKDAELICTNSNHPEHLARYLDEGRYLKDAANFAIGHRMVVMALDGKNPLQEYLDPKMKMRWLGANDDYFVEGVQMGAHGHLGVNGAKGGYSGLEVAYGNAMLAHVHSPGIQKNLYKVGHLTHPRHGYNDGPSTWIQCNGAVYRGGQKQLMMIINGDWTRRSRKKPKIFLDKRSK